MIGGLGTCFCAWAISMKLLHGSFERLAPAPKDIEIRLLVAWPNCEPRKHCWNLSDDMLESRAHRSALRRPPDHRGVGRGKVVPAFEVLDAVGGGVAEMGHTASFYWQGGG